MLYEKRRHSKLRVSQRRYDFSNAVSDMIREAKEIQRRGSMQVIPKEIKIVQFHQNMELSYEIIEMIVKDNSQPCIIIGICLPQKLLEDIYFILTNQQWKADLDKSQNSLFCIMNLSYLVENTKTIIIILDEKKVNEKKPDQNQKFFLSFCSVLITTQDYARARQSEWEAQGPRLFDFTQSILIILDESKPNIKDSFYERLQQYFWSVDLLNEHQLGQKTKFFKKSLSPKLPFRNAYRGLVEQNEMLQQFSLRLSEICKLSIKANIKYIQSLLNVPLIYLLNCWLKNEGRDLRQLYDSAALSFCMQCQDDFKIKIQNFTLPCDQIQLRNSVENQKKIILKYLKKQLFLYQITLPKIDVTTKYIQNFNKFLEEKEREIYLANISHANKFNEALLNKIFNQSVLSNFQNQQSERNISHFEKDFTQFVNIYSQKSIRVSTQLKIFNQFMIAHQKQYTENLLKELRHKKNYGSQNQDLNDRIQIQSGLLQTLEHEIQQLEQKRRKINLQNELMKESVLKIRREKQKQRKDNKMSVSGASSPRRYKPSEMNSIKEIDEFRIQPKQPVKPSNRCCCQLI